MGRGAPARFGHNRTMTGTPPASVRSLAVRLAAVGVAFACLLALAAKTVRLETDFTAFLPPSASPEQRLLISQLRDGLVSRLMLVALQGADEKTLAQSSQALAATLAAAPEFEYVANGSLGQFAAQSDMLMRFRYALSPEVSAEKFTPAALHAALEEQRAELASPFGVVTKTLLTRDPTGEFIALLKRITPDTLPATRQGVWFSADGKRAFLIAQTRAAGFDSVRQADAMARVRAALGEWNAQRHGAVQATLTGPGVFAAESHQRIERDAWRLSLCSALVVLALLAAIYRSALPVVLVATPVAFGLLAGVLVVQAWFGSVHGITLGFAATLIGEAVDYPNYLLLNTAPGERAAAAARRLRATFALAVLTTVASALALTLSSFTGLAQLGILTMVGVTVAGAVTYAVIPWMLADRAFRVVVPRAFTPRAPAQVVDQRQRPRRAWASAAVVASVAGAALWLAATQPAWLEQDLANISPVSGETRALDTQLRREMGAPEVGFLLASRGATEAAALREAGAVVSLLQEWKARQAVRGFDSPSWYLPDADTQAARRAALPGAVALRTALDSALRGLGFRPDAFAPFLGEVEAARGAAPVTRAAYAGTPLGARLAALVIEQDGQWLALTPLTGVRDASAIRAGLAGRATQLVDLKQISTDMVGNYRGEALRQAGIGALLIALLLVAGLRSPRRALRVLAPCVAALVLTVAALVLAGQRISVFHLVALLLVLGIGLNYALFFERRPGDAAELSRTRFSLAVCSVSTVATFGFLALSATPVLRSIGSSVALGAVFALLLGALWARPSPEFSSPMP